MRRAALAVALMLGAVTQASAQSTSVRTDENAPVTRAEIRELIEAAQATAKASRENVEYARVVPDLLFQILAKLDKLEDKLDKVETSIKADRTSAPKKR